MKISGIIIFLIAGSFFIFSYNSEQKTNLKKCDDLIMLFRYLNVNVLERKMIFTDALYEIKGKISRYIDEFINISEVNNEEIFIKEKLISDMRKYFSDCKKELLQTVIGYIRILGTTDKKTSMDNYEIAINDCEKILNEMKADYKKNIRLTKIITYGITGVTILVLI